MYSRSVYISQKWSRTGNQALSAVLGDQRPGFRCLADMDSSQFGPFRLFFDEIEKLKLENRANHTDNDVKDFVKATLDRRIYVPAFRFDHAGGDVVVPIFPNCYPTYDGEGAREKEAGLAPVQDHVNAWFPSEGEPYMFDSVERKMRSLTKSCSG